MKHLALLVLALLPLPLSAAPRPVGDAEREAVAVAAAFLAEGPRALWSRLADDAPLRALPESDAIRELAARTGPREGARWSLQTTTGSAGDVAFHVTFPSGYDDGLLFRMKRAGGRWVLREVLTLAETPPPPQRAAAPAKLPRKPLLVAVIVLALFAAIVRSRVRVLSTLGIVLAATVLGITLYDPVLPSKQTIPFVELRDLTPLREALARGDDARVPQNAGNDARAIAALWIVQSGAPLTFAEPKHRTQLSELVRARIALANDKPDEARAAFERALAIPPLRDDILAEAATSIETFVGDRRMADSRDASLWYARARNLAAAGDEAAAHESLRTAWRLEPLPRADLVRDPRLFPLLHDVRALAMVSLLGTNEPAPRSASFAKTPVALPAGARAFVCGDLLRVEIGNATLEIDGGAALAPPDARVVPATYWTEQEDAAALRDAESLLKLPARATAPAARTRVLRAADALAHHNRWRDLLILTDDITPRSGNVAPELLVLRLRALLRADRVDDARALAEGDAVKQFMQRTTYPATLLSIADAMANVGRWDTAANLYGAVKSDQFATLVSARVRQLELRRALAATGATIATAHFDIRHAADMNPAIAQRIGELLEAELARLQQKLPPAELRRVTVNVLSWDDFRREITGSDHILGLYDGEILFPFAVVHQFKPEVVAIITHELTHALLAQATGDNAPRWFQEGVAQRMELVPRQENAFAGTAPEVVLPVPLLDAVMKNAVDPFATKHGYQVAQTFIRFLENRYGDRAVATLVAEFAKGKNTDDALTTLAGKSLDELNREFRQWGFVNNAHFVNEEPWPYSHWYSPGVDPRIREGFKWSRRP